MPTVRIVDGLPHVEATVAEERAADLRKQALSISLPLTGDSEQTKTLLANLRLWFAWPVAPREEPTNSAARRCIRAVRAARYRDWARARA